MPIETAYTLAQEARAAFVRGTRPGANEDAIWTRADDAPEWVADMVYDAHDDGAMGPDDWRYRFIVEALDALLEALDEDGSAEDAGERLPEYIHKADAAAWLNSHEYRAEYADDAAAEMLAPEAGVMARLFAGMHAEQREVLASVMRSIEEHAASIGAAE